MAGQTIKTSTKQALQSFFKNVDKNAYWGAGAPKKPDTTIKPFAINVDNKILDDLQHRLKNTRQLTPPLEGIHQQYGLNTHTLKEVVDFWANKYNWRDREKLLNQYPQFKTEIQGLDIHFLHVKPTNSQVKKLPLLLLHGWPGSVKEFYKIMPLLTNGSKDYKFAFEVIAPSLPGYIFSDGSKKPGLGAIEMAILFKNFMARLGHEEFYIQGGDWGGLIVRHMATLFPENILGLHSNFSFSSARKSLWKLILGQYYPDPRMPKNMRKKTYPLKNYFSGMLEETGYFHIQATKPDTVGAALNDSPAGLASYILEKFSTGTKAKFKYTEGAGLLEKFTYEDLLDNVTLYWVTNSMTTAMRLYAESFNKRQLSLKIHDIPIDPKVPCAIARFPHEVLWQPDYILRDKYSNIIQSTDFEKGGHFAAFEEPKLMADDIFKAVSKMERVRK